MGDRSRLMRPKPRNGIAAPIWSTALDTVRSATARAMSSPEESPASALPAVPTLKVVRDTFPTSPRRALAITRQTTSNTSSKPGICRMGIRLAGQWQKSSATSPSFPRRIEPRLCSTSNRCLRWKRQNSSNQSSSFKCSRDAALRARETHLRRAGLNIRHLPVLLAPERWPMIASWVLGLAPPSLGEVAIERGRHRTADSCPSGNPLLRQVEQWDGIEPGDQKTSERPPCRHKIGPRLRLQQCGYHGVDRCTLDAHVIAGARLIGGSRAPIKRLLIAGRQRLLPAVLDHVEVVIDAPRFELNRIDDTHARCDARSLQALREDKREALFVPLGDHDLESEGSAVVAIDQGSAAELEPGGREQVECALERRAIATGAIADRRRPRAFEHVRAHRIREACEQRPFAGIGGPSMGRQLRTIEVACRAPVEVEEIVAIDPFEVEQIRQRFPHTRIPENFPAGIEDEIVARLGQAGAESFLHHKPITYCRERICRLPPRGIMLVTRVVEPALECLHVGVGFPVKIVAKFVEVPETAIDRKIARPIIGVALQRDAFPRIDSGHNVRPASEQRPK